MKDYHARISQEKRNELLRYFALDLTADRAASFCKVSRNTANQWYGYFRHVIFEGIKKVPRLKGEVEMDQAFFGKKRKRSRMVKGKLVEKQYEHIKVFGIIERGGSVYTHLIDKMDRKTLFPITFMIVRESSTIYTDMWRSFETLGENGYTHKQINHSKEYARKEGKFNIHINNIEAFWSFTKRRLKQFNGVHRSTFRHHLKECEFRYNNRKSVLPALKKMIKKYENSALFTRI